MSYKSSQNEQPSFFDLETIAGWQLKLGEREMDLPPMQRGFVWKVGQMEALWDSLLRGYPIGSFLFSSSPDGKRFLMDGQQRATSIALGFNDIWKKDSRKEFWSLGRLPSIWIDLSQQELAPDHHFSIRVCTRAHPWGYQHNRPNIPLSVKDRSKALEIFKKINGDSTIRYVDLNTQEVFPYDTQIPVPMCFLLESIQKHGDNWKEALYSACIAYLPQDIRTKRMDEGSDYRSQLEAYLRDHDQIELYEGVKYLLEAQIPGICVQRQLLKADDYGGSDGAEDPTLFVRLNSAGTPIDGEELIYSIYKASFPRTKQLVDDVGANFVKPSLVISIISRLVTATLSGSYPPPLNIVEFRKRIKEEAFRGQLEDMIGNDGHSPAATLFARAVSILRSEHDIAIPPVVVKKTIREHPDLFLLLLKWLSTHPDPDPQTRKKIIAAITALAWFCRNNAAFVRNIWDRAGEDLWDADTLSSVYRQKREPIMYPLLDPIQLRTYLLSEVIQMRKRWDVLAPSIDHPIGKIFLFMLPDDVINQDNGPSGVTSQLWNDFLSRLSYLRPMVLFAQRHYINSSFGNFNHMDDLEDTNTPWDWDHIYPSNWIYMRHQIDPHMRHWNNTIGNLRALGLEQNRSEGDSHSPAARLEDSVSESFVKEEDWRYWQQLTYSIKENDQEMVTLYLNGVLHRMCNIYEDWYETLQIGNLFK